jgi:hypothetical protein
MYGDMTATRLRFLRRSGFLRRLEKAITAFLQD